jgi:tripeptide aminopeptidase
MFNNYEFTAMERLIRYVTVDTQSDPHSETVPSTEKQKDLSSILVAELLKMGIGDAHMDEYGYVYATIPGNSGKQVEPICFCSHVDTAPDCSGTNVKPLLHKNYTGADIVLPDDNSQVLGTAQSPYLKKHIGHNILTASGNTLLGSDDKAGVAIIMDFANYLLLHPEIKHGPIRILFTPDEEVGKGTAKIDMQLLNAKYGYTLDGGEAGSLEDETFSADAVDITIHGVIAHPGYAKGKLVNALKIAGAILTALPNDQLSPETTEGREGFVHPLYINGLAEKAVLSFIIRDFTVSGLLEKENRLKEIVASVVAKYPKAGFDFVVKEQYRNMKEILDTCYFVVDYAKQAIERTGLSVTTESIRGGTDGSRLSYMGLPCPNIFTGMQNIHSKLEWIGEMDMKLAVQTLVHLSMIWEENGKS